MQVPKSITKYNDDDDINNNYNNTKINTSQLSSPPACVNLYPLSPEKSHAAGQPNPERQGCPQRCPGDPQSIRDLHGRQHVRPEGGGLQTRRAMGTGLADRCGKNEAQGPHHRVRYPDVGIWQSSSKYRASCYEALTDEIVKLTTLASGEDLEGKKMAIRIPCF